MKTGAFVDFTNIALKDGFWHNRTQQIQKTTIDAVKNRFEETGRFDAMRFNYQEGKIKPHIFFDSDVAKWIEAVAYVLESNPPQSEDWQNFIDDLFSVMEKAQMQSGYLNSYHQQIRPDLIFQVRDNHELYCLGHFIEAAIAYHHATGKRKLLDILEKYCDYVYEVFVEKHSAAFDTPGHPEIEQALYTLYRYTNREKYKKLTEYFLLTRGNSQKDVACEEYDPKSGNALHSNNNMEYAQSVKPIYELDSAKGHCVRALYLYSAIADMALENNDEKLKEVLDTLWADMTQTKMYINGGVGASPRGEGFTVPYDLPNHTAYTESCCAIAFCMLATRMRKLERNAKYGHLIERELYNNCISSYSLDAKAFFYSNPLEIPLEEYGRQTGIPQKLAEWLPKPTRSEVFDCSCCPPNIARFIATVAKYICFDEDSEAVIEQYIPSTINSKHGQLSIDGDFICAGKISVSSKDYRAKTISMRIPEWCSRLLVNVNGTAYSHEVCNGYIRIPVSNQFTIDLDFNVEPVFMACNPYVRANVGRVALCYGPMVYCLEGVDNGNRLNRISVDIGAQQNAILTPDFHGAFSITIDGWIDEDQQQLYFRAENMSKKPKKLKFIPYFAFANRVESDMIVWIRKA